MAFNYQAIINSINNFAAKYGLTMYAYTPNFKGVIEALDNLQNIQFTVEDGTIVNADVNINAAIDGTKISPDFGNQTLLTTGNVGIGTTSPTSYNSAADNLVIGSTGDNGITIATGTSNQGSLFFADGTSGTAVAEGYLIYVHGATEYMALGTSNTERMRIDSSGNVIVKSSTSNQQPAFRVESFGEYGEIKSDGTGALILGADPDFNAANSTIKFNIDGTERMRIDSSGNVGIGTTGPLSVLHTSLNATDGVGLYLENRADAGSSDAIGLDFLMRRAGGTQFGGTRIRGVKENAWTSTASTINSALTFSTLNSLVASERMRIDSSGKVGIGTTVPSCELDIENSSSSEVRLHIANTNSITSVLTSTGTSYSFGGVGASTTWLTTNGTKLAIGPYTAGTLQFINGGERMRIDSSGRLLVDTSSSRGVGDATPAKIQVDTTNYVVFSGVQNLNNHAGAVLSLGKSRGSSAGGVSIVNNNDTLGIIKFAGADGTDVLTTAASIKAEVDGTPGSNDMPGRLVFLTTADGASSPTERMRIKSSGEVLIPGTYSNTTANGTNVNVHTDGNLRRSTSSAKYKTSVETVANTYSDALLNCRPVWYRSTCNGDNPEHSFWGFIAEEVAEIDPRLVHWKTIEISHDEDGSVVETPCDPEPEGVAYERFVPHLLNLIKRQQQAIKTLEQRLSDAGIA